jgi:hypothetical protein
MGPITAASAASQISRHPRDLPSVRAAGLRTSIMADISLTSKVVVWFARPLDLQSFMRLDYQL